jgi:thymidylate synthase
MNTYPDTHTAYREVLRDVFNHCEYRVAPRGLAIREKCDYAFRVERPSAEAIITADGDRNGKIAEYTAKEVELYNSGTNKVADFAKASKFWEKLANPDGTINSAYGHLLWWNYSCTSRFSEEARTPWEWARDSLLADRDTRQAVMHFNLPDHAYMGVKDFPCTMHADWLIRDGKLNLSIVMRSNDVVLGLVYDLPWFCGLIDRMLAELKSKYPDLQKGTYTHFVHSIHAYERDSETIKKMLGV